MEVDQFYTAVNNLNNSDKSLCENAAKFLSEFQKSVHAWSIAHSVLTDGKSLAACTLAAQTLRQKLVYDFQQLPSDSYISLRTSLIGHICSIESLLGDGFQVVVVQLCVALADLYLQVPEWNEFISDLLSKLTQEAHENENIAHALLELLKVFPEEIKNKKLRIGENRRSAVEKELALQTEPVLQFLEEQCRSGAGNVPIKAVRTFGAWISNSNTPTSLIAHSQFFQSVLTALLTPECDDSLHSASSQAICEALQTCKPLQNHMEMASVLINRILNTDTALDRSIAEGNIEKTTSFSRVYTDMCIMILEPIVNTTGEGLGDLRALDFLLRSVDALDYIAFQHTFDVWYNLSESLYYLSENEFDEKKQIFKPFVERYVYILYKHCRFEEDVDAFPSENDEFVEFRNRVAESIKDVTFIIGTLDLVEIMAKLILENCQNWRDVEAGLFIIKSTANCIVSADEKVTPQLIEIILRVQGQSNSIILNTTVELIGEICDWLAERETQLLLCMDWMLSIPVNTDILLQWASSVEKLTSKGHRFLYKYFEKIHSVLKIIESSSGVPTLLESAAEEVLKAAANLINDRPADQIAALLSVLLAEPIENLEKICFGDFQTGASEPNSWQFCAADPLIWLDRIACIYRVLRPWPSQAAYQDAIQTDDNGAVSAAWYEHSITVWKKLALVFDQYKASPRVMEHCCRTTRFVIRSIQTQSMVFMDELAQKLINTYEQHPHSCILYLSSIIVDEYGIIPQLETGLITMLNVLAPRAFGIFSLPNGPRDNPETVDDLFRLAIRYCHRMPKSFFAEPIAAKLLEAAIHLVSLDHPDANKAVVQFLTEVVSMASSTRCPPTLKPTADIVKQLLLQQGQQMTWQCINASVFTLSAYLRYDVAQLLKSLLHMDRVMSLHWLDFAIEQMPRDTGLSATSDQLVTFKEALRKAEYTGDVNKELSKISQFYS